MPNIIIPGRRPNEPLITEDNYKIWCPPQGVIMPNGERMSTGRDPAFKPAVRPFMRGFPMKVIPEDDWKDAISDMTGQKRLLSDLAINMGLPCKDQNGTNYCWIFAPTHCMEVIRLVMNQPMTQLSPASVGCIIKNFRNSGGWGTEGLEFIAETGLCPSDAWPDTAINRKYDTPAINALRTQYKGVEWATLNDDSVEEMIPQIVTLLLNWIPVAAGYNWWSHEITLYDVVWTGTGRWKIAFRMRNSWSMDWGDRGFSLLEGSRMIPDDACYASSATPSARANQAPSLATAL